MYAHALNQTIQIANHTGTDADDTNDYGEPIVDALENTPARVDFINKTIKVASAETPEGTIIQLSARILLLPGTVVDTGDKVIFAGNTYRVESKNPTVDRKGVVKALTIDVSEWR